MIAVPVLANARTARTAPPMAAFHAQAFEGMASRRLNGARGAHTYSTCARPSLFLSNAPL